MDSLLRVGSLAAVCWTLGGGADLRSQTTPTPLTPPQVQQVCNVLNSMVYDWLFTAHHYDSHLVMLAFLLKKEHPAHGSAINLYKSTHARERGKVTRHPSRKGELCLFLNRSALYDLGAPNSGADPAVVGCVPIRGWSVLANEAFHVLGGVEAFAECESPKLPEELDSANDFVKGAVRGALIDLWVLCNKIESDLNEAHVLGWPGAGYSPTMPDPPPYDNVTDVAATVESLRVRARSSIEGGPRALQVINGSRFLAGGDPLVLSGIDKAKQQAEGLLSKIMVKRDALAEQIAELRSRWGFP